MANASQVLDALGDPTRRAIFESLAAGPRSVGEVAAGLPISRPAVSQHLKVLKEAGLVRDRAVGTRRYYEPDPAGLVVLRGYLDRFWDRALSAFARAAEEAARDQDPLDPPDQPDEHDQPDEQDQEEDP
jgi:DNA-binding transcriptional ArsR family regulator